MNEKLKIATDDSYLDPTNLSGKLQKHQNFDIELNANKNRCRRCPNVFPALTVRPK